MYTWNDLVRRFFPDADDEQCDFLLWELTCYPHCGCLKVARQLNHIKKIFSIDIVFASI